MKKRELKLLDRFTSPVGLRSLDWDRNHGFVDPGDELFAVTTHGSLVLSVLSSEAVMGTLLLRTRGL